MGLSGAGYGLFGLLWVLSRRDPRFHDALDSRTTGLFVIWFFVCIVLTWSGAMQVGNVAHGTGAVMGVLVGLAITELEKRALFASLAALMTGFGLWAATLGRPLVNVSLFGAYDECGWGYQALKTDHYHQAERWLKEAVRYRSAQTAEVGCWFDLAIAEQHLGNHALAFADYHKAAELGEKNAQYYLGTLYESDGAPKDKHEAMLWYNKAADQGVPEALNNLAWDYATDPTVRNPQSAPEYATKAVAAKGDNPTYLDTLAEAQYANGEFEDAVKTEQKAMALPEIPVEERADMAKRLTKYVLALRRGSRVARFTPK